MSSLLYFLPNLSESVQNINQILAVKNAYDSTSATDLNKQNSANIKLDCLKKYKSLSFKTIFLAILLPIILLFIIINLDIKNYTLFKIVGSWLLLGFISSIALSAFYLPYKKLQINSAINLNKDTCESI